MRRIVCLLWGLTLISAVSLTPLQAGLIAFYPFEGNANDATGHGNDGTVWGLDMYMPGYQGQAHLFDGGSYVSIPVNINPGVMPQLTMGAWAKAQVVSPVRAVISHDNGGFDRNLNLDNRGGCAGSACWSAFTGGGVLPGPTVTADQWVFLAVRYNAATNSIVLDVDTTRLSTSGSPGSGWDTTLIGSNPSFGEYFGASSTTCSSTMSF